MDECPECGTLDALAQHAPTCQRAISLGLPRLAEGEEPIPVDVAPDPVPDPVDEVVPPSAARQAARRRRTVGHEPRMFSMIRAADESGVSGTGRVLDGVVWHNGKVTVQWRTANSSIAVYDSFETFEAIHITPHPDNGTVIEWADERLTRALAALQEAVGTS